jgi:dTDP-4-amino-4,6-dideoxygalactose transaminase
VLLADEAPDRDVVLDKLAAAGVGARPLWPLLHRQAPYQTARRLGGEVADDLYRRGLSLPSSATLSAREQETVVDHLRSALTPQAVS